MARRFRGPLSAALVVGLAGLSGCGREERLVPVSGRVIVNGKPLPLGKVVFQPDADRGNTSRQEPRGSIDDQGVYRLSTGDREGAPPGWYRVAVFAMKPGTDDGNRPVEWLHNPRYTDARGSGLSVQVVEDPAPGTYDLALKP